MSSMTTPMRLRLRDEALFGRLPATADERQYSGMTLAAAGLRLALTAWAFLVGGYTAASTGALDGALMWLAGNVLGVAAAAACALGCNRYGIDPIDGVKACFGQRGAKILLLFFWFNQMGWAGLMLVMFGRGVQSLLIALNVVSSGVAHSGAVVAVMVVVGGVTAATLVARGTRGLTWAKRLAMPGLAVVTGIVFYGVLRDVAWADLLRIPALTAVPSRRVGHVLAFECALGTGLSWWPVLGRLTRQARTQRASFFAPVLTLGVGTAALCTAGHVGALLFRNDDPTQWLVFLGGHAFGALTLLLVAVTNMAAAATILRTSTASLRHIVPLRALPWSALTALAGSPLLLFAVAPAWLYEHGGTFVRLNATLLAPLCAVYAVDYFVLRRQRINLSQVFENDAGGAYWFFHGVNPAAFACALAGQVSGVWLFDRWALEGVHTWGAAGPAVLVAALSYLAVAKLWLVPSGHGSYEGDPAPMPLIHPNI